MAKVTRFNTSSLSGNTTPTRSSRPEAEKTIAQNNLALYQTQLSSMTNQTNVIGTLYMIDEKETTFSETLGVVHSDTATKRFIKVRNFIVVGSSQEEFEERQDQERALAINLSDKEFVFLANTLEPKEGWYMVFDYQPIKKPYVITSVNPIKYHHKDAWRAKFSESKSLTFDEIEQRVTKTMDFVYSNIGTSLSTVVDADLGKFNDTILKYIDQLQSNFVETFYNIEFDTLGFSPTCGDFSQMIGKTGEVAFRHQYIFNHYANDLMQQKNQILKFGYDRNVLFLTNVYNFDRTEVNYRTSIYIDLLKRKFKTIEESPLEPGDNLIQSDTGVLFDQVLSLRDFILEADGYDYKPKYSYHMKYFLRRKEEHMILTRLFNSGIVLVDMLNTASFVDPALKSNYSTYQLKHPRICEFLDKYMDKDYDGIRAIVDKLDDIYIDKDNIDDYMGIPLLLLALNQVYVDLNSK